MEDLGYNRSCGATMETILFCYFKIIILAAYTKYDSLLGWLIPVANTYSDTFAFVQNLESQCDLYCNYESEFLRKSS